MARSRSDFLKGLPLKERLDIEIQDTIELISLINKHKANLISRRSKA